MAYGRYGCLKIDGCIFSEKWSQANTVDRTIVGLMLVHRLLRCRNIKLTLGKYIVFARSCLHKIEDPSKHKTFV